MCRGRSWFLCDTPLDRADSAPGHRQGPHILAPGPGSGGGNRPPRRQVDPGAPPLPRGAPKGRHNCHFQPAAGESDSESGSRLRFLQKRPRGVVSTTGTNLRSHSITTSTFNRYDRRTNELRIILTPMEPIRSESLRDSDRCSRLEIW